MKIAGIKHYSKALVEIAHENNCWDEILADLESVDDKINENLDFKKYLDDRQVSFEKKQEALKTVFQDFISSRTYNFVYLLLKSGKLLSLSSILELARKHDLKEKDLMEIIVESVIPLTPKQEKKIVKILSEKVGAKLILKNLINKELIAGVRIFFGDTEIDSSLQGKIVRLKQQIENYE
jgi:F-type H+-transporting ATPase subunit delta